MDPRTPTLVDLLKTAVHVTGYKGQWACPICKKLCWYECLPDSRLVKLFEAAGRAQEFIDEEHALMVQMFQREISEHMRSEHERA